MKKLFCLLLLASAAFGYNAKIDCSSTTLGTSYSTSSPSLPNTLRLIPTPNNATLIVTNGTNTRICANANTGTATVAPSGGTVSEHCVPAGMSGAFEHVDVTVGFGNIFLRADGTNCTIGIIDVDLW